LKEFSTQVIFNDEKGLEKNGGKLEYERRNKAEA